MNNWFKWVVILIGILAVIWLVKSCHKSAPEKIVVKHDTTYVPTHDTITIVKEVPAEVKYLRYVVLHDTLEKFETVLEHVDSARILAQYTAIRKYDTTINVRYGTLRIQKMVTQNRVALEHIDLNQEIPEVKETITKVEQRAILLAGITAIGNENTIPYAAGVTLDLKFKNDKMIGVGGLLTKDRGVMYQISFKSPIRLHKQ